MTPLQTQSRRALLFDGAKPASFFLLIQCVGGFPRERPAPQNHPKYVRHVPGIA
jgi:hypothetical protein